VYLNHRYVYCYYLIKVVPHHLSSCKSVGLRILLPDFFINSCAALGGFWPPPQLFSRLLSPVIFLSSLSPPSPPQITTLSNHRVRGGPILLLENNLFYILLGIHFCDISSTDPSHLMVFAFTNLTISCPSSI